MTPTEFKLVKDEVTMAIKAKSGADASKVFFARVAEMTDAQASAMMQMIAMDLAS